MNPAAHELARARMAELTADAERARVIRRLRIERRAVRRAARKAAMRDQS